MCSGLKSCCSWIASWCRTYNEYDNEDPQLIEAVNKLGKSIASYNKQLEEATQLHATLKGMINLKKGDYTKDQKDAFAKIKQVLLEAVGAPEPEEELPPSSSGWCCRRRKINISILENAEILKALRPLAEKIERLKRKIFEAETSKATFEKMVGKSPSEYDENEQAEFDRINSVGSSALPLLPFTGPVSQSSSTGTSSTVKRRVPSELKAALEAILKAINSVRYAWDCGPINSDWMNPAHRLTLYKAAIDAVKAEGSITQEQIDKALPYISDDLLIRDLKEIRVIA